MRPKKSPFLRRTGQLGFTRTDLLLVIAIVFAFAFLAYASLSPARPGSKEERCRRNLKELGTALSEYRADNADDLPVGYVRYNNKKHTTWDSLIGSYIRAGMRTDSSKPAPPASEVNKLMLCPADTIPPVSWSSHKSARRTYSMAQHDMKAANWPPASANRTGIGLHWADTSTGLDSLQKFMQYSNQVPAVTGAHVLAPSDTLALGEQAYYRNILGNSSEATLATTEDHVRPSENGLLLFESLHDGEFIYLLLDGRVERMLPDRTVGLTGSTGREAHTHKGIWTIRADD